MRFLFIGTPKFRDVIEQGGSQDSIVSKTTHCRLDGTGIESRWEQDFPKLSRTALGPTHSPVQWVPGLSQVYSGQSIVLITHPPSTAKVKERVQLYLYSPSLPVWPVLG